MSQKSSQKSYLKLSHDGARTWNYREWNVPSYVTIIGFPKAVEIADGTILVPVRGRRRWGDEFVQEFVSRSTGLRDSFALLPLPMDPSGETSGHPQIETSGRPRRLRDRRLREETSGHPQIAEKSVDTSNCGCAEIALRPLRLRGRTGESLSVLSLPPAFAFLSTCFSAIHGCPKRRSAVCLPTVISLLEASSA